MKKDVMYTYKMDETGKVVDIIAAPAALSDETTEDPAELLKKVSAAADEAAEVARTAQDEDCWCDEVTQYVQDRELMGIVYLCSAAAVIMGKGTGETIDGVAAMKDYFTSEFGIEKGE